MGYYHTTHTRTTIATIDRATVDISEGPRPTEWLDPVLLDDGKRIRYAVDCDVSDDPLAEMHGVDWEGASWVDYMDERYDDDREAERAGDRVYYVDVFDAHGPGSIVGNVYTLTEMADDRTRCPKGWVRSMIFRLKLDDEWGGEPDQVAKDLVKHWCEWANGHTYGIVEGDVVRGVMVNHDVIHGIIGIEAIEAELNDRSRMCRWSP